MGSNHFYVYKIKIVVLPQAVALPSVGRPSELAASPMTNSALTCTTWFPHICTNTSWRLIQTGICTNAASIWIPVVVIVIIATAITVIIIVILKSRFLVHLGQLQSSEDGLLVKSAKLKVLVQGVTPRLMWCLSVDTQCSTSNTSHTTPPFSSLLSIRPNQCDLPVLIIK